MTFKKNWEQKDQLFQVSEPTLQAMVKQAFPKKILVSHELLSGGCANLNMKLNFLNDTQPLILRIYLRDKDAAYREQKLAQLIKNAVPMPEIYFVGDCEEHRFSIAEFREGIRLRDLLLDHPQEPMENIIVEAGQILALMQQFQFPTAGFFDADLHVESSISHQAYITFAKKCLIHPNVIDLFSTDEIRRIDRIIESYEDLFPDETERSLVHGDFDPANILVHKVGDRWIISAILDWEFAFSGSWLTDVANMLRYGHHMPPVFEDAFLLGLKKGNLNLPPDWRKRIHLLNLTALLDCFVRADSKVSPRQCADICDLINDIMRKMETK